ncbi:MAG: hypothetical protein COV52_00485 [Gammaproteobacteria bacterium CG11_big_fil_rev_8_21_14_0_20_46_22]|nr:MAG: hypothetical protein COW05_09030 [Gammaproteobacteria bacterium CG12_big_fil_rev_8_21_14_0_65_46_12]PIR12132.1 MAG: hypothetical protein COV52_00485 [Gammaproteobacteria bacterium CG11_big_fil_rev_8_21_14_0_20_46_22]
MQNVVIIGAGSMGRIVYSYLIEKSQGGQHTVKGFLDANLKALKDYCSLPEIIGTPDDYLPEDNDVFVMAIADPGVRKRLFNRFKQLKQSFLTFIHPLAYIASSAELGEGCVVGPFVNLAINTRLGACVFCNVYTSIGHDVEVGDFSILYSHCSINGFCRLGEGVLLGAHTVIVPEVDVGDYVRVMAGSSVLSAKVKSNAVLAGVPAEEIFIN